MSLIEVNGFPCSRALIQLPLTGVGYADIKVAEHHINAPVNVDDAVEVTFETGETFQMTCVRAGKEVGFWRISAVLGAGKLNEQLSAKFYDSIPAKTVIAEIAEEVGEQVDKIEIGDIYAFYVRLASKASQALHTVLLPYDNFSWRMNVEGKLWVGEETWPESPEFDTVKESPNNNSVLGLFNIGMMPGQTSPYGQIDRVTHIIQPNSLRTEIRFS